MVHADSPTNLHWLINNATRPPAAAAAQTPGTKVTQPADDLSSIKLNLDALG